jgi:3',5'-cyclic AMP phosphodiesterase CpdA
MASKCFSIFFLRRSGLGLTLGLGGRNPLIWIKATNRKFPTSCGLVA